MRVLRKYINKIVSKGRKQGCGITTNPTVGIHTFAEIDWLRLAVENDKTLLISMDVLEKRPYNDELKNVTWENCTLRKYLNGEFLDKLGVMKSAIVDTCNSNPNNPWYGTAGGNATTDKVFLLSLDELVKYLGDNGDLHNTKRYRVATKDNESGDISYSLAGCIVTAKYVAKPDGNLLHDQYNDARQARAQYEEDYGWTSGWWLRSPGVNSCHAAFVDGFGVVNVNGNNFLDKLGVRPALWLNL